MEAFALLGLIVSLQHIDLMNSRYIAKISDFPFHDTSTFAVSVYRRTRIQTRSSILEVFSLNL
ncbi:MAG: hypothetical protein PVF15_06725 [Candidatus Bathyarchaeota archaeon]